MTEATAKEQIGKEPKFKNLSKEVKAKIFKDNADKPINKIGAKLLDLRQENKQLGDSETDQKQKVKNIKKIKELKKQFDEILPDRVRVAISENKLERLNDARDKVRNSDLPWFMLGVSTETGKLEIHVNSEKSTDIESDLIDLIGKKVPYEITYRENTGKLQAGSCASGTTGYCDPVIGGGYITEDSVGKDCTIGLAVERSTWWGTEKGIIIPDHCNIGDYMMQNTWDDTDERFGKQTDDGGWYCDCDFIKSDGRDIDVNKINKDGDDYTIKGKTDANDDDEIWMNGITTGYATGKIVETGQSYTFTYNGQDFTFDHLYKISGIDYTDGDSGSPIINADDKFVGMSIGGDVINDVKYQFGHEWSFLQDRMELKD